MGDFYLSINTCNSTESYPPSPTTKGHLAVLGDIFDCGDPERGRGGATDIYWAEARDATK